MNTLSKKFDNNKIKTGITIRTAYQNFNTKQNFLDYAQARRFICTQIAKGSWLDGSTLRRGKFHGKDLDGFVYHGKTVEGSPANEVLIKIEDGSRYVGQ
jgi:hypothetical protein